MIAIIRAIVQFLKTWFLPQPAHDEYEKDQPGIAPDESDEIYDEPDVASESAQPDTSTEDTEDGVFSKSKKNHPTESQAVDSSRFNSLVKPPEGTSDRASRGSVSAQEEVE